MQEDEIPVFAVKPGRPLVRWHSQAQTNIALTLGGKKRDDGWDSGPCGLLEDSLLGMAIASDAHLR